MVLYLRRMCRCVLHAVSLSHIGTLMRLLSAKPRNGAGLLLTCLYLCGIVLVTPYSMVWDWQVSGAGPMPFYWRSCSLPFGLIYGFPFLLFHSIGWYCGAGVSDWYGGNRSVPDLHCQPFLIIIIIIIIIIKIHTPTKLLSIEDLCEKTCNPTCDLMPFSTYPTCLYYFINKMLCINLCINQSQSLLLRRIKFLIIWIKICRRPNKKLS